VNLVRLTSDTIRTVTDISSLSTTTRCDTSRAATDDGANNHNTAATVAASGRPAAATTATRIGCA
jgi:hypothetical protein